MGIALLWQMLHVLLKHGLQQPEVLRAVLLLDFQGQGEACLTCSLRAGSYYTIYSTLVQILEA